MRVLTIFIDMINTTYLSLYENEISKTNFDDFFINFLGTTYTNIYTPAPDTYRSLSSFWSGVPPYNNGCDKRGVELSIFLKGETFLSDLVKNNTKITILSDQRTIFPQDALKHGHFISSLNEIYEVNNHFVFIDLLDSHNVLDDVGYSIKGVELANQQVTKSLNLIFNKIKKEDFDSVIFFSDHGHFLQREIKKGIHPNNWLSNGRTRIFLHIWNKNEESHQVNNEFGSIMDLNLYLRDLFTSNSKNNYSNLKKFQPNTNQVILIEDFHTFSITFNNPDVWRLKSINEDYIFYFKNNTHTLETFEKMDRIMHILIRFPHLRSIIESNLNHYEQMKRWIENENLLSFQHSHMYYFDDTPRFNSFYRKIKKFIPLNLSQNELLLKFYRLFIKK